ncbi:MAG: response regulator [Clostridiales Family XIII bacterium]|nr:response regulator [Clostridiales Family XIII bacterium]
MSKKLKLLVVDDIDINRLIISELFSDRYEVIEASNGKDALAIIDDDDEQLAVVLLDMVMPVIDGFGVLQAMNRSGKINTIPVILVTSEDDDEMAFRSYSLGVSDVIHKPFNASIVNQRVTNVIDLYVYKNHLESKLTEQKNALIEQEGRIKQMNFSLIDTLSAMVEFRDIESGKHIQRTRMLIKLFLENIRHKYPMTDEQIELISSASVMHDVGKIAIPDAVLLKPGKLTSEEYDIMKTHTVRGSDIIKSLDLIQEEEYYQYCHDICRYHHERYDGKGYPDGLIGEEVPIWAQAAALTDVYDALTSKRVYKDAYTHEKAIDMIVNGECGTFNPALIDVLHEVSPQLKELAQSLTDK